MTLFAFLVAPALAASPDILPYVPCATLGEVWTGSACSGDSDVNLLAEGHNAVLAAVAAGRDDLTLTLDDAPAFYADAMRFLCADDPECDADALAEDARVRFGVESDSREEMVATLAERTMGLAEVGAISRGAAELVVELLEGATRGRLADAEVAASLRARADGLEVDDPDRVFLLGVEATLDASAGYWGSFSADSDPFGVGDVDAVATREAAMWCGIEGRPGKECRRVAMATGAAASAAYVKSLRDAGMLRTHPATGSGHGTAEEDVRFGDRDLTLSVDQDRGLVTLLDDRGEVLAERTLDLDRDAATPEERAEDAVPMWAGDGWLVVRVGDAEGGWLPR